MKTKRDYQMRARGEAVAETHERILAAGRSLAFNDLVLDPTLQQVAAAAKTTVQTVLRHFGSRAQLLVEIERTARDEINAERTPTPGHEDGALIDLMEHYERRGDFVMALIAREATDPQAAKITTYGRAAHRRWVADVFAPRLPPDPEAREAAIDLLVVATDLFTWQLLRRDRGHSPAIVMARMKSLIRAASSDPL
jgi:AcrR family transcriptional regulator